MEQLTFKNEMASHTLKHRAVCKNDSFKGPWRAELVAAHNDARQHRQMPGNELHRIEIITNQTFTMKFEG